MKHILIKQEVGSVLRFIVGIFLLMNISGGITAQEYISLPDSLDCFTPKSTLKEISLFVEQAEDRNDACVQEALSILMLIEATYAEDNPTTKIQDSNIWGLNLESLIALHPELVAGSSKTTTPDSQASESQEINGEGYSAINLKLDLKPDTLMPEQEQRVGESIDKSKFRKGNGAKGTEITVDKSSYTIEELVTEVLVTGCLQAYNVSYSGDANNGIGFFSSNGSAFPLDSGIIIATGNVSNMVGPNGSSSYSDNLSDPSSTDGDLLLLNNISSWYSNRINDEQILEFDFVPAGDIIQFNFVFASEEYEEYFCSYYNDKFGFILSGPGINGSYSNNGENIAKLPDGTLVAINNVGPSSCGGVNNSAYYTAVYQGTEFDGSTVVLTAEAQVQQCEEYHIRIMINDYQDDLYDSGVFLEANSFSSNDIEVAAYGNGVLGSTRLYEGCNYDSLVITRASGDNSQELEINMSYSPAGMNGTDILQDDGTPLPDVIVLPVGVDSMVLRYYAVDDGNQEPAESETFTMIFYTGCPCDPVPTSLSMAFTIYDPVLIEVDDILASNVECAGEANGVIIVNPLGGSGTYEFKLDAGPWQYSNTFTNLSQGSYSITVRDSLFLYNCQDEIVIENIEIEEPEAIIASAGVDKTICSGVTTTLNGSGGALFSWSPSDWLSAVNVASPTVTPTGISNSPVTKTYTLTVTDSYGNCASSDQVTVLVNPTPDVAINVNGIPKTSINVCPDDITTLQGVVSAATTTSVSNYLWSTAETTSSIDVSPNSSQTYSLEVENEYSCSDDASIQVLVYPFEVSAQVDQMNVCPNDQNGIVSIVVSGHTGNLPVTAVLTGPTGFVTQSITFTEAGTHQVSGLITGDYTVSGLSSAPAGCTSTATFTIEAVDDIIPTIICPADISSSPPTGQTSMSVTLTDPTGSDNCTNTNDLVVTSSRSDGLAIGDNYPLGQTIITWTVEDEAGNSAQCEQIITIILNTFPGGVSSGLALWVKSNAGVFNGNANAVAGEKVTLWDDYVLNHDALQTVTASQPLFSNVVTDQNNYNPGVIFDGSDDYLISDLPTTGLEDQHTIFVVATPAAEGVVLGIGQNSALWFKQTGVWYEINENQITSTKANTYPLNTTSVLTVTKSGNSAGTISISFNGTESTYIQTESASLSSATDTRIGVSNSSQSAQFFEGNVAEVILYNRVLTAVELKKVETYLAVKYGITLGD